MKALLGKFSRYALLLSLVLTFSGAAHGQATDSTEKTSDTQRRPFFDLLAGDFLQLFRDREFLTFYNGMVVAPSLMDEDPASIHGFVNSDGADRIFELGDFMGSAWTPTLLAGSACIVGVVAGKKRFSAFASDLIRAQLLNGFGTATLKYITDRQRPDGAPYGFPSGHTSSSFATAAIVRRHFGKYWGGMTTLAAAYVGVSRLQENKHYVSDVLAGAVLGTVMGNRVSPALDSRKVAIIPAVVDGGVQLTLLKRF